MITARKVIGAGPPLGLLHRLTSRRRESDLQSAARRTSSGHESPTSCWAMCGARLHFLATISGAHKNYAHLTRRSLALPPGSGPAPRLTSGAPVRLLVPVVDRYASGGPFHTE